jgi:DNA invertase Pin-like site-specific DNA recombinase
MIQERVKAGLARTKAKGTVLGRPRVSAEIEQKILDLRISNPKLGMIKIAKEVGVGVGTVQRLLA